MSASEVKELHEYEYSSTFYWKEFCTFKENCNKLKTDNSVEEITQSTERISTEFERKVDFPTDTAEIREESEESLQEKVDITGKSVSHSVQPADEFETDKFKETTSLSKKTLENSNVKKSEQHVACNTAKQKDVNKRPENPENSKQVEDWDVANAQNVNDSIDTNGQTIENGNDPDKGIQGDSDESSIQLTESDPTKHIPSVEELHVQALQEEPGKGEDLENQTKGESSPERRTADRIQKIRSRSSGDSRSKTATGTSEIIPEEFKLSFALIVLIIMTSTIA